jgi:ATP-binding cassette subfamily B protein
MPIMFLLSSSVMALIIFLGLIFLNPVVALTSTLGFMAVYLGVILVTKNKLLNNSLTITKESTQIIKAVQEGLGGIREVLLDGNQIPYWSLYQKSNVPLRNMQASTAFIGSCPRYVIESISMLILALIAYYFASKSEQGILEIMPFLGVLAIGAQRLLPMLQQIYSSITSVNGARYNLLSILNLLEQPVPDRLAINNLKQLNIYFQEEISMVNVSYRYANKSPWVLKNLNLSIYKGDRVGLIGPSGGGKSTLIDIVMGLLEPNVGEIIVDGKVLTSENIIAWQKLIAHVPQVIFLSDSTVAENIAFGVPMNEINYSLVYECAHRAQLAESIQSWEKGYDTIVGERGVKLSGGQRQRIGIARAFYKQASVIIFDEATSALDGDTEKAIMKTIDNIGSNITIIIIAHRITTLKNCNRIIEISNCGAKSINYKTL